jgi:hypothetical protein
MKVFEFTTVILSHTKYLTLNLSKGPIKSVSWKRTSNEKNYGISLALCFYTNLKSLKAN